MANPGADRDLDGALTALVAAALRRAAETGDQPPADQARLVAQALAVGLRELVRAPLREALQAGYDLGWRAAQDAHRHSASASPSPVPDQASASPLPSPSPVPDQRSLPAAFPPGAPRPASSQLAVPAPVAPAPAPDPHYISVEVAPLANFSAVNRFHAAVAGVPEVVDTTMVAFRDGRLTLQVDHPNATTLAATLQALDIGPLRVLAVTPARVELAIDDRRPSKGARPSNGREDH